MIQNTLGRILFVTLFSMVIITSSSVAEENTRLKNMTVTNTRDNLLLYFEVENAFTKKILDAVNSGVTISFSFPVAVNKPRDFWFDKIITEAELNHTIKYDTLKNEYIVTRSWKSPKSLTIKSIDEAKSIMTRIDGLTLLPLDDLKKGEQYQVMAKAKLDDFSAAYYLKSMLFFLTFWNFETDWDSVEFVY